MEKLVLIGAGGYAKSALDSLDIYNYRPVGFIDSFVEKAKRVGYPILGKNLDVIHNPEKYTYFISIGNNHDRKHWYELLRQRNLRVITIVDHTALVSPHAKIGHGCFIGKFAIINSMASIGNNSIVNTKALVEHGCHVSDHVNLSTNSVINGDVHVGTGSFIGSCSVVIGQKIIGDWSTVGAGAVVTKDVGERMTVAGIPARIIKEESVPV